ncbi:biotin--[acetyl-CoA-carboxylase] ligase [Auraticoccus sp. F435]|uniref:biotin--[biotin carboxyl-carrier protein] ligase n=1 Tax=Auraticoccus cholistanensis TaxID=2656650 RepID=A0A6A9UU66_9ACTN|nr:biotin--[acetyl-CoA-carboxylase] ligase [Auraticoccus cholistanensis]MVA76466.1 biotin--[acetyl-CoA-carboxylase] ligase [Auraticoccus cholistanensis]
MSTAKTPPGADATRLTALLDDPARWSSVEVVDVTGSTNADLAAAARAGRVDAGAVLLAWHQERGRGRLERTWTAPPGTSAAVSVLLAVEGVPPTRLPWLPLAVGLAVASGIEATTGVAAALKWPNDVLVDGRKVCGILAQRVETPGGAAVVVGFGLNLTQDAHQLPVPTATSLRLAGAGDVDRLAVVAGVLTALGRVLDRWRDGDPHLVGEYRARCDSVGREVVVHLPGDERVTGRAVDVDDSGRLVVRTPVGPRAFSVGDVVHLRATPAS